VRAVASDRLEDIKASWSERHHVDLADTGWLIAEVERLRGWLRRYGAEIDQTRGRWDVALNRAARWRELARRRREQHQAWRENSDAWQEQCEETERAMDAAQNLACAAAFDCGRAEAERGKAVDATRDAWRNEYEHQRSLVEINRIERRRAETQRDAALARVAELEGLLRDARRELVGFATFETVERIDAALEEKP
jgi:hypothetical protein